MVLSDNGIKQALKDKGIEISGYEDKQLQPASYDLRVGRQVATLKGKKIEDISERGFIVVEAGDSALISTHEVIRMDASHAARFGLTSGHARRGIYATTGTQVDPGYHGRLFVGITNLMPHPVTFTFKQDFLTLEIHQLLEPSTKPYAGPYQGKTEFDGGDVEHLFSSEVWTVPDIIKSVQSSSREVRELAIQVKMLMWLFPVMLALMGIMASFR